MQDGITQFGSRHKRSNLSRVAIAEEFNIYNFMIRKRVKKFSKKFIRKEQNINQSIKIVDKLIQL